MKLFTKELFIQTIDALQKQEELDIGMSDAIGKYFIDGFGLYDNSSLKEILMTILYTEFDNLGNKEEIDYFIYELDFGKDYKEGCVTKDGVNIPMATAEDLWNQLNN